MKEAVHKRFSHGLRVCLGGFGSEFSRYLTGQMDMFLVGSATSTPSAGAKSELNTVLWEPPKQNCGTLSVGDSILALVKICRPNKP